MERAVQYVRGNFWAGECFSDLADAQARVEAWCRERAGMRIHGTTAAPPAGDVHRARIGLSANGSGAVRRADLHPGQGAPRLPRRGRQGVVLGARAAARGSTWTPAPTRELVTLYTTGGAGAGRLVKTHPRQPPGGRSTDRDDLPEHKAGYALRDLSRLIARLRRARAAHRHLRRAAAGRPAALDQDARRLPAARPGPPLRPRPGGGRLRTVPGPGRRVGVQDRLDARQGPRTRTADPARRGRLAHTAQSGRFARDPRRVRPTQHRTRRRPAHPHPRRHDPVRRHHHTSEDHP